MARPKAVLCNGFRYDGTFTSSTGIAFETPEALHEICLRSLIRRRRKSRGRRRGSIASTSTASEPAQQTLTRDFIIAQHRFYGVPIFWKRRDNFAKLFRDLVSHDRVLLTTLSSLSALHHPPLPLCGSIRAATWSLTCSCSSRECPLKSKSWRSRWPRSG